jgi:hypothetical protein
MPPLARSQELSRYWREVWVHAAGVLTGPGGAALNLAVTRSRPGVLLLEGEADLLDATVAPGA